MQALAARFARHRQPGSRRGMAALLALVTLLAVLPGRGRGRGGGESRPRAFPLQTSVHTIRWVRMRVAVWVAALAGAGKGCRAVCVFPKQGCHGRFQDAHCHQQRVGRCLRGWRCYRFRRAAGPVHAGDWSMQCLWHAARHRQQPRRAAAREPGFWRSGGAHAADRPLPPLGLYHRYDGVVRGVDLRFHPVRIWLVSAALHRPPWHVSQHPRRGDLCRIDLPDLRLRRHEHAVVQSRGRVHWLYVAPGPRRVLQPLLVPGAAAQEKIVRHGAQVMGAQALGQFLHLRQAGFADLRGVLRRRLDGTLAPSR